MTRITFTFSLSLETEHLGHPYYQFKQRQMLLLEGTKENWQKKVALSCS